VADTWRGFTGCVHPDQETSDAPITVAIERRVDAHRQAEALAWVQTGTSLASRMPGYLGSGWVRASGSSSLWYTLYRFADAGSLAGWESSDERRWWLHSGEEFVHDARVERRTGIEGWFDVSASSLLDTAQPPAVRVAPPRWKQAVTIWLGFFPTNLVFSLLVSLLPVWGVVPLARTQPEPR
jgi:antibiotic biosynthesis monooxygenase (ABM) superfamily enzyme